LPTLGRRMVCEGEKDTACGGEKAGVGSMLCGRRGRMTMESVWRCGGVEAVCKIKELRSKIPRVQVRAGNLLYWGAGAGVLGVQCGEGCEGCRGIWGCSAVKERKETVTYFLTKGKHGNKVGFGGTGEIIGGAGRSPLQPVFHILNQLQRVTRSLFFLVVCHDQIV